MSKEARYLAARQDGKTIEQAVAIALPATDPKANRFADWVANADERTGFSAAKKVKKPVPVEPVAPRPAGAAKKSTRGVKK